MKILSLRRLRFVTIFSGILIGLSASAAPGGNGGGGGKPPKDEPPPPPDCSDSTPGFAYLSSGGISIANANGCFIGTVVSDAKAPQLHSYSDGSPGSVLGAVFWLYRNIEGGTDSFHRAEFEVDGDGTLLAGSPVQLLPMPGELNPGETANYFSGTDVWGDPTSSTAYLTTVRRIQAADRTDLSYDWIIYQLDESGVVDSRILLSDAYDPAALAALTADGCADNLAFPHQVPACYKLGAGSNVTWHPSGSRLYVEGKQGETETIENWQSTMRIDIDNRDADGSMLPLAQWVLSDPEMVYIGTFKIGSEIDALYQAPSGGVARPRASLNDPDLIGVDYYDHSGNNTVGAKAILNADACVDHYAPYSDGFTGPVDYALWRQCEEAGFVLEGIAAQLDYYLSFSWQSPDTILDQEAVGKGRRQSTNIYRRHVSGGLAGSSELLVEGAEFPQTAN